MAREILAQEPVSEFARIKLSRTKMKEPWRQRDSTLCSLLTGRRAESNIAAIVTTLELNKRRCLVSQRARGRDVRSEGSYGQNPAAGCDHLIIRDLCSSVENLDAIELCCLLQT